MKRLLSSTTAISIALVNVQPWPLFAQTLTDSGSVVAADGTVLCEPTADAACDPTDPALVKRADEIAKKMADDAAAAAAAAAEAEAAAAAQAQAEAEAAAKAQAEAEAAAAAQAQAEADAAAAAQAQAEADAAAKAQADADAAAAAQAQADADAAAAAQAQADADAAAQAQADADAAAKAQADADAAQAQADADAAAAAQAEADAAAKAEADKAAAEPTTTEDAPAADASTEAPATDAPTEAATPDATTAEAPATDATAPDATTPEPAPADTATGAPTEAPATDPASETATTETTAPDAGTTEADAAAAAAALAAAEAELAVQPDGTLVDPSAGLKTEAVVVDPNAVPVDAPVPTEAETTAVADLLVQPFAATETAAAAATPLPAGEIAADAPPPADAISTVTEILTADSVRTSAQEFAAAPVAVSQGKKSGLSNLEKFGLVALGALAVGTIINQSNKANAAQTTTSTKSPTVVSNTGDRVVVLNPDGTYTVYKDDDAVIRQPGSTVRTETYNDGSTRTIITRDDGTQIVTIRDALGRVLRRAAYDRNGNEMVLIDDLRPEQPVVVSTLPKPPKRPVVISTSDQNAALKAALAANDVAALGRTFSLRQIRDIPQVRWLAPQVELTPVTFDSGSAAIKPAEAKQLADLGRLMQTMIDANPGEMFLIEGHTDATGKAAMNLALSDRRAESVALALTEYFDIPPENMIIQGYGETELLIDTQSDEKRNRRVEVRIITALLNGR